MAAGMKDHVQHVDSTGQCAASPDTGAGSFLIDANDRIVKAYENVYPGVHTEEVLRDAKALGLSNN